MRIQFPNGEDASKTLTPEQIKALEKIQQRWEMPEVMEISPMFIGGCIMINVGSMWLGVETDGYTHS